MRITAAVARTAGQPLELESCELDAPQRGEVRVRVEACGICHTDLVARDQYWPVPLPAVLGHEGVGIVEALGEGVTQFAVGDRVLMSFGACGHCGSCREGQLGYCQQAPVFQVLAQREDGSSPISCRGERVSGHFFRQSSFASHAIASTVNLVKLEADLPPQLMAPLACGVLTGAGAVLESLQAEKGCAIAVVGCGAVGLSAIMAAKIAGCEPIVAVDVNPQRLALAEELGASVTLNSAEQPLKKALKKLGGMHYVVDTTGITDVMREAFSGLRSRGTLLCVGVSKPGSELSLDMASLLMQGKTVRGCIEGDALPADFVPRLIQYYRQGELPLEKLVTSYPFSAINQAIEDAKRGRVVKAVLSMQQSM